MDTTILHGDCRQLMAAMPDASVDAIVTDPPYEIGFMGKGWDNAGVAYDVDLWRECLRVLKPGGHLLAFGGTRTYHRMAVAIEEAGFEIRDSLHWLYGSGFPKSLDVSKAIDKVGGNRAEFTAFRDAVKAAMKRNKVSRKSLEGALGNYMLSHYLTAGSQPAVPNYRDYVIIRDHVGLGGGFDHLFAPEAEREVVGTAHSPVLAVAPGEGRHRSPVTLDITAPATDAARQWEGWGTALKPAHEPIVVARKPLVGTVVANVLEHGTGAVNIDGSRVAHNEECRVMAPQVNGLHNEKLRQNGRHKEVLELKPAGRWPANIVFTHVAECEQVGTADVKSSGFYLAQRGEGQATGFGKGQPDPHGPRPSGNGDGTETVPVWACAEGCPVAELDGQSDGASRFFTVTEWDPVADVAPFRYVAKPSKAERNAGLDGLPERNKTDDPYGYANARRGRCDACARWADSGEGDTCRLCGAAFDRTANEQKPMSNHHPTVKPVALMRWLVRLVTPPGGTILDPFLGSGTTGVAAVLEGFNFIGCELTDDYLPIIEGRIAWATQQTIQPDLFQGHTT